jgi:hypothetical protein
MTKLTYERGNLHFETQPVNRGGVDVFCMNVTRISDAMPLTPQWWFEHDFTTREAWAEAAERWIMFKAGADEPEPTFCADVDYIGRLINPQSSHAHSHADGLFDRLLAAGHRGWDLDRRRAELAQQPLCSTEQSQQEEGTST